MVAANKVGVSSNSNDEREEMVRKREYGFGRIEWWF